MIELSNVSKKYGDTVILENTSYKFPKDGIVCLIGPSGGGKTTLLNLLAGFDTDYQGKIFVCNKEINQLDDEALCAYRRDNIGFVFQNYNLLVGYTVMENVCIASQITTLSEGEIKAKAARLLSKMNLEDKQNQKVENLSGGQKQRVAIARALMSQPQILFADEPTGALDRKTSTEIMGLLQEISKDRLVVLITHDEKICEYADEVIRIKDKKIVSQQEKVPQNETSKPFIVKPKTKVPIFTRALKNFKVHAQKYIAVSLAISIGLLAFLFSLSFKNVMESSITDFQNKNTAFNNGYIKGEDNGEIISILKTDERIENVYYQYKLENINISLNDISIEMPEKYPMPKATENLSYGVMPRAGKAEISLSPSLAKKFNGDIKSLIGKSITIKVNGESYDLIVSGIFNAGYDDFFISCDIEQKLYKNIGNKKNYSISYDVKEFSNIFLVTENLIEKGIETKTAAEQVRALQDTFDKLNKLFLVVSVLILLIGLFICTILLFKLQNSRYKEVGLLSALGFTKGQISQMIQAENLFLSSLAAVINLALVLVSILAGKLFNFTLVFSANQVLISTAATFIIVLFISAIASYKLLRTQPAQALRM